MTSDISDDNRFKKSLINIHYKINTNYKSWAIKSLTMRVEIVKTGKKRFWRKFVSASMSDDVGERSGLQGLKILMLYHEKKHPPDPKSSSLHYLPLNQKFS